MRTGRRGRKPQEPSDQPESKSQRNFTDPESRIMKDGATKSFEQCYNCQAAVDQKSQIVVAATVTQEPNDKQQVEPLIEELDLLGLTHNLLKLFRSGRAAIALS